MGQLAFTHLHLDSRITRVRTAAADDRRLDAREPLQRLVQLDQSHAPTSRLGGCYQLICGGTAPDGHTQLVLDRIGRHTDARSQRLVVVVVTLPRARRQPSRCDVIKAMIVAGAVDKQNKKSSQLGALHQQ